MRGLRNKAKRILVGAIGGFVLIAGIIMIPYPGPGWVVVFIGLSILGTEFAWAQRLNGFAKSKYDAWQWWVSHQPLSVRAIFWVLTALVVVITVWLVNGYGIMNQWLHLGMPWLNSPFVR